MNNRDSFTDMPISFEDAIAKVSAVGIEPGLEAITELLRLLGNPQRNLAVIHVTGTNGKGSVCAMLESILREAGFRTGLYTSPHMIHYNERFRINGESIGDDTLMALLAEAGEAAEGVRVTLGKLPTEFEILTAMAFLWFSRENVDALVLEVGLGGRYDATNVFPKPLATIITNVTMDHEGYLGDTTAKIAWEKAGIIKEGVPLITACDDQDALQVIQKEFSDVQGEGSPARLWQARGKCHWKTRSLGLAGQIVDLATPSQYYENIELPLPGQYQCVNLACAALVWELLVKSYFPALNMFSQRKLMKETLQKGITSVSWPCRLELVQEKPDVVLDGSHNPDGLRHLAVWLSEHRHLYRQVLLVMGMVQDKDRLSAAKHLNGLVSQVIITKPLSDRAGEWEGLAEGFDKSKTENVEFIEDCHQAVQKAIELAGECDLVLCTGSFFLVGELRKNWIAKEMFSR